MARQFSVIGDSNIRRNMTTMNMASRQAMSGCQIIDCPSLSDLENSFTAIRAESDVCIFQAVTHLLLIAPDIGTVQSTIDTLFHELSGKIVVLCKARPDLMVTLCPPMYRPWPLWYRHHLAEMASGFSQVFGKLDLPNLMLLPSFINQDVTSDGHLSVVSGLHFLLHLFDQSEKAIDERSIRSELKIPQVCFLTLLLVSESFY